MMVRNGHSADPPGAGGPGAAAPDRPAAGPIPRYGFHSPGTPVPGIEPTDLAVLRRRVPDEVLRRVHRTDFHALTLVTRGEGAHTVDFVDHPCRPGTLLWVRPGQVQRFPAAGELAGPHLIFTPDFPPAAGASGRPLAPPFGPVRWDLSGTADRAPVAALLTRIAAEYRRPPGRVSPEVLRFLLGALLLHVDRLPDPGAPGPPTAAHGVYARFREELERSYHRTRRAEDYAAALGYSVKSLTRACLTATGQPVKQVIDARVVLQAKRLLAHTGDPVSVVARRLGFTEPTNFGKYFARHTGTTPGGFRRAQRGGA
ncbi:AraC family transcriptional regulator [Streptomyces sp. JNUCC 64]